MKRKILRVKKNKKEQVTPTQRMIMAMESLMSTEGWAIIMQILQGNIEVLEEAILEKREDGRPLNDLDVDRLRDKRGFLMELMNTPQNYIEQLRSSYTKPENFDPYYKDPKEMVADRAKKFENSR